MSYIDDVFESFCNACPPAFDWGSGPLLGAAAGETGSLVDAAGAQMARHLRIGAQRPRAHDLTLLDRDAVSVAGAAPFSTQLIRAVMASNWSVPTPPRQWNMPGTMNKRKKSGVSGPFFANAFS